LGFEVRRGITTQTQSKIEIQKRSTLPLPDPAAKTSKGPKPALSENHAP